MLRTGCWAQIGLRNVLDTGYSAGELGGKLMIGHGPAFAQGRLDLTQDLVLACG